MQKIVPHLWFDTKAREAAQFYVSIFGGDSKVTSVQELHDTPSGDVDIVSFSLWGYSFMSISAGPLFSFNPSISISVQCESEEQINALHKGLSEGGKDLMPLDSYPWSQKYAWTQDTYGLTWQLNLPEDQSAIRQRINPALMYTKEMYGKAEEAIHFYISAFPDSKIHSIYRYEKGQEPEKEGMVAHGEFELSGELMMAQESAGSHNFKFNEAVSLMVYCDDQDEIDRYWQLLSAVPEAEQCGWLKDKYGVSWQIVPRAMDEMMANGGEEQIARVTQAFLQMKKFDLAGLESAYRGEE